MLFAVQKPAGFGTAKKPLADRCAAVKADASVSPPARIRWIWPLQTVIPDNMNRRNRRIELRLTEAEAEFIREKSKGYASISQYIRQAVAEFSDTDARRRLELVNDLGRLYREYHNELFHMSANLNQVVRRANELAVAGLLSKTYLENTVLPAVQGIEGKVLALRQELLDVTKKATKLK